MELKKDVDYKLYQINSFTARKMKINYPEILDYLFTDLNCGIYISSPEGQMLDCNDEMLKIFGYTDKTEFLNIPAENFYKEKIDRVVFLEKLKQEKFLKEYTGIGLRKNGTEFHVIMNSRLISNPNKVDYIFGSIIDQTQLVLKEKEFINNELKYQDLYEHGLEIIQRFDTHGKLIFCNQAWYDKLEYTPFDAIDVNLFDLIDEEYRESCRILFKQVLGGRKIQDVKVKFITKSGHRILLKGNVVPIIENGKVTSAHSFFNDITEEKESLDKIKHLEDTIKILEASVAESTVLMGEVHHRVKNNLAIIDGLLGLKKVRIKDTVLIENITDIQVRIRSIALVHQKLYQSGNFNYVNISDYIIELTKHFKSLYNADGLKNIMFSYQIPTHLNINISQAIPLGLLVSELISNSCKYALINNVLHISFDITNNDQVILLKYQDSGLGLPQNVTDLNSGGFGLKMMSNLVKQLKGTYKFPVATNFLFEMKFTL